jgi:hypothetical protein
VDVAVGVLVGVLFGVDVAVSVGVEVAVGVLVVVGVEVWAGVLVGVELAVDVLVGVEVGVFVAVGVLVGVLVDIGVGVGALELELDSCKNGFPETLTVNPSLRRNSAPGGVVLLTQTGAKSPGFILPRSKGSERKVTPEGVIRSVTRCGAEEFMGRPSEIFLTAMVGASAPPVKLFS